MNDEITSLGRSADGASELIRAAEVVEQKAWIDLFEAAPLDVRNTLKLSHHTDDGMRLIACPAIPITELNRAMVSEAGKPPSREQLGDAIDWLDRHATGGWAFQIAPHERMSGVRSVLTEMDLKADTAWAKFVHALPLLDDWTSRDVSDACLAQTKDAGAFGITVQSGFGLPAITAAWFSALVDRPGWQFFTSFIRGEPVGAAAIYISGGAAWAGMSATLPEFRERGVQGSLIAARLNAAASAGARLVTNETGLPPGDHTTGSS